MGKLITKIGLGKWMSCPWGIVGGMYWPLLTVLVPLGRWGLNENHAVCPLLFKIER